MDAVVFATPAVDGTDPVLPELVTPVLNDVIDACKAEPVEGVHQAFMSKHATAMKPN